MAGEQPVVRGWHDQIRVENRGLRRLNFGVWEPIRDYVRQINANNNLLESVPDDLTSNAEMKSELVWDRVRSLPFVFLLMFQLSALAVLLPVKQPKAQEHVLYYVLLCSVLASMLIVSTKGVATYGMMALRGEAARVFRDPVFYGILAWFVLCLVLQGRFWNEALAAYDSSKLVPIYFVLYVMAAMLGAAVLYGEILGVPWLSVGIFAAGCAATFLGVFLVSNKQNTTHEKSTEEIEAEMVLL